MFRYQQRTTAPPACCGLPSVHGTAYSADAYPTASLRCSRHFVGASCRVLDSPRPTNYQEGPAQLSSVQNLKKNPRGKQIEAPLTADSVRPSRPFAVTGVDFADPLYVKVGREAQKAYIDLFACATTTAVYLELCTDMTTAKFLMALQRFIGRRGLPHTVYSMPRHSRQQATNLDLACPVLLEDPPVPCSKRCS